MAGLKTWATLSAISALALVTACNKPGATSDAATKEIEAKLQQQLLDAKPGDVIEIPAGTFHFDRSLSLDVDGVTIKGAGMDKTILSFKGQKAGAEGLLVNASNFTIQDLAIEDSKGDALKVNEGENVIIRRVRTEWTNGPSTSNGAYGLYPVQIKNVLIEDSVAIAAADAGIYVGQSENIVVRRNKASKNVAGIEIENSQNADVYDNVAEGNTGGILVFNMPQLTKVGRGTRVFHNKIVANNEPNFGAKGLEAYKQTLDGIGTFFRGTSHHNSNVVVDFVSETEAHVRSIVLAVHRYTKERPDGILYGQYFDTVVKVDGQWKFKRRELRTTLTTDYHVRASNPIGRAE